MNGLPPEAGTADPKRERLDSWKKIASYLKRDVSTVQRWERRESMPVHRHQHEKLGSVYAYKAELDQWWAGRAARLTREPLGAEPGAALDTVDTPETPPPPAARRSGRWPVAAAVTLMAAGAGWWAQQRFDFFWSSPLANAQFRSLTDFDGIESSAAISRDGTEVAFLADRDGQMDVWATRVGSGSFRNLTHGSVHELVNASIRTLGFSPDGGLVSIWSRQPDGSKPEDINLLAVPATGGALRPYLAKAAEYDWSADGRIVYHSTAPGDPMFIRLPHEQAVRHLYTAPAGEHCHFPVWSPDGAQIYFVCGKPPDRWDIWRIASEGGTPERLTTLNTRVSHLVFIDSDTLAYLACDSEGAGPWLYARDLRRGVNHRLTSGIEQYTSLAGSGDASRLVVTVASTKATLWRLPLGGDASSDAQPVRVRLDSVHTGAPRLGPDYLLYVITEGASAGLWKTRDGASTLLWRAGHARVLGSPSIAPGGQRIAFVAGSDGHPQLHVVQADGTDDRSIGGGLELSGSPDWTPDGRSIVCAVIQNGVPHLYSFPLDGGTPAQLVAEYSIEPSWSPDGAFVVYSGPDVGTTFPLRAAAADGRAHPLPSLVLTRGARRVAFHRGAHSLVVLKGTIEHKDFWLVDLDSGAERQLSHLPEDFAAGDFDVSGDGKEIVFDRIQATSDLVQIDRPHR